MKNSVLYEMRKVFWSVVISLFAISLEGYAQPTVKISVNPDIENVLVASELIALTAKASGKGLKYQWELTGTGELQGDPTRPAIFYKPPTTISGNAEMVIVTVIVTDETGKEETDSRTFKIVKEEKPPSSPTPTQIPKPPTIDPGSNDCTSITANGYDVILPSLELVGTYKEWKSWDWVKFAINYAKQENASEVFAYEVYKANETQKKDGYYAAWRFEVNGSTLNYDTLLGTPDIETGSCWKQFTGKIPYNLLASGTSKIVIYVLKQK